MKKIQFIVGLFAAALLVASCSEDYNHHNLSNNPITFTPTVENSDWNAGETRGTLFTGTSFGNNDVFGVSAYRYDGTTLTAATASANFMYNTQISRIVGHWRTEEEYYWPADGDLLDFYAYYPYNNNNVVPKSQDTPGPMQIVYTVNSNPLQQVDLMTAHAKGCTFDNLNAQALSFTHQLTAVNLVLGDNVAPGYIKSISFEHIATQGTLTVGTGWSEMNDATFTLDMKAYYDSTNGFKTTDNNNNIVTGDAANLTAQTTTLLMIPQTLGNANQKLKVLFVNEENPEGLELSTTLTDPWVAGSTLTYQLTTSDINVLKIAAINYPSPSTWGNSFIRTDYEDGDDVGLYAIDAQGNVQVDNVKLTRTSGAWVDGNGSTPLYAPGLKWFMYYPWKNGGLAHEGKKNNVTVTNANDFFETGINAWTINADQQLRDDFLAQDLQVGTGVFTAASTLEFNMEHTMGILHLTIPAATDVYETKYYNAAGTAVVSNVGSVNIAPTRSFVGNIPYQADDNYYLFIAGPGDLTISATTTSALTAWDGTVTNNTVSFTETLSANSHTTHNVTNKLITRGYVYKGWAFPYTGSYQTFTSPKAGSYLLECWGAQGGTFTLDMTSADENSHELNYRIVNFSMSTSLYPFTGYNKTSFTTTYSASSTTYTTNRNYMPKYPPYLYLNECNADAAKGGYSYGIMGLTNGQTLHICVGGQGGCITHDHARANESYPLVASEGYNGGGKASVNGLTKHRFIPSSGGGATHIATEKVGTGILSEYSSSANQNKVLLVAGGGGGGSYNIYNGYIDIYDAWPGYAAGGAGGGETGGQHKYFWLMTQEYYVEGLATSYEKCNATQTGCGELGNTPGNGGNAAFGKGTDGTPFGIDRTYAGGGGGWYGGNSGWGHGGGGGSGHIKTSALTNYGMKKGDGTDGLFPAPLGGTETGQVGNGYARIRQAFIE